MDDSPLGGQQTNAGVRIAMLMRLHRFCHPEGRFPRQADLREALVAAGHHATTTALSRAESGSMRSGRLLRGYEDVLGLEDGALRAVADHLCRSQPDAPADRDPVTDDLDVHALSVLTAEALADGAPGAVWYAFGRAFGRPDTRGLPVPMMREALDRLDAALRTSGGPAWVMQLQALHLLADGPYAPLLPPASVAPARPERNREATPGRGASAPRAKPRGVASPRGVEGPKGRAADPRTKDRRNADWTWSHDAAHALAQAHRLPEQPVLARVLYDVLAHPCDARALDAGVTLACLPFARAAIGVLERAATVHPEPEVRARTARRLDAGWARG